MNWLTRLFAGDRPTKSDLLESLSQQIELWERLERRALDAKLSRDCADTFRTYIEARAKREAYDHAFTMVRSM